MQFYLIETDTDSDFQENITYLLEDTYTYNIVLLYISHSVSLKGAF